MKAFGWSWDLVVKTAAKPTSRDDIPGIGLMCEQLSIHGENLESK